MSETKIPNQSDLIRVGGSLAHANTELSKWQQEINKNTMELYEELLKFEGEAVELGGIASSFGYHGEGYSRARGEGVAQDMWELGEPSGINADIPFDKYQLLGAKPAYVVIEGAFPQVKGSLIADMARIALHSVYFRPEDAPVSFARASEITSV